MNKQVLLATLSATVMAAPVMAIASSMSAPASAAIYCQCTQYVANRFGLRGFPHAGDWDNSFLPRNGFRRVAARPGAIVVMERSFPGSNRTYGHVGIVHSVDRNGRIQVRGANQYIGTPLFTEAGCNNVRITGFGTSVNGRSDVSFWSR